MSDRDEKMLARVMELHAKVKKRKTILDTSQAKTKEHKETFESARDELDELLTKIKNGEADDLFG